MAPEQTTPERRRFPLTPAQYWIAIADVTSADVNKVLEIYGKETQGPVPSIDEEEFARLKHRFETESDLVQLPITRRTQLEWRRTVDLNGSMFVRFKFGGGNISHVFREPRIEQEIQKQIDAHFEGRSKPFDKLT